MTDKILKAWGKGPVKFGDMEIDCYVLPDGTPILNKGKMMVAIGRAWKGASRTDKPNFIGAKNLQPFIRPELETLLKEVEFFDGGRKISGYDAKILPHICKVYWEAGKAGVLTPSQLPVAEKCEILTQAFALVGITAIIYEQLGFEKMKHPEAFRMLVDSYLGNEIRKWSKEVPDEFFWQLDRIYGNQKTTYKNRPQYYAKFIRKYIYEPLEIGEVLKRLDIKNPITNKDPDKKKKGYRKHKFHTLLSEEIGLPAVRAQIWQVIAALKMSPNKRVYETNFARIMGQTTQGEMF